MRSTPGRREGPDAETHRRRSKPENPMSRVAITMPKLAYDMAGGKVVAWIKRTGDQVARGHVIAKIETEKPNDEMESTVSGTVVELVHECGVAVPVGDPIAFLVDGR